MHAFGLSAPFVGCFACYPITLLQQKTMQDGGHLTEGQLFCLASTYQQERKSPKDLISPNPVLKETIHLISSVSF